MENTRVRLTRQQLYALVWTRPIQQLAKDFGLSDVGFAKISHRLEVPTPPRGYWQKLAKGLPVQPTSLPSLTPDFVELHRRSTDAPQESKKPVANKTVIPTVSIATDLRSAHAVTSELSKLLTGPTLYNDAVYVVRGRREATLRISPEAKRRALLALDALFHAAEVRGHSVRICRTKLPGYGIERIDIEVVVDGQAVELSLVERTGQKKREPTKSELESERHLGFPIARKFDRVATGNLTLLVRGGYRSGQRFADRARVRLESQLGDALVAIEVQAESEQLHQQQVKIDEAHAAVARRRAAEEQRQRDHMHAVVRDLRKMTKRWMRANEMRQFIAAYEATLDDDRAERVTGWVAWARSFADSYDPLTGDRRIAKALVARPLP